jgi:hypothetical protein
MSARLGFLKFFEIRALGLRELLGLGDGGVAEFARRPTTVIEGAAALGAIEGHWVHPDHIVANRDSGN